MKGYPSKAQQVRLLEIYNRDRSVAPSFLAFRRTAHMFFYMDTFMVQWKGMVIGIEPDGYAHT